MINKYFIEGCIAWGIVILLFCLIGAKSRLHLVSIEHLKNAEKVFCISVMIGVILICVLPMGLSPIWNGENPGHRNQYELMAESILEGHLYIDYKDIDSRLLEMEDPYDAAAREEAGIYYHWDHAFYNGHYYMYFGIVPVFLVFLPYRIITGANLTTYHATQIFVMFYICGVFAVLHLLSRKFFPKITLGMYVLLASAFSMMSVWYSVTAPALYCTADTAGICMEVWSLYCFIRAVWDEKDDRKSILYAFCGSIFGALAFGCRPPVALANIAVIPMLVEYVRRRKMSAKLIFRLIFAAAPYVVVAVCLMVYNTLRFNNPFEFGQAYQLTVENQSNYGNFASKFNLKAVWEGVVYNFAAIGSVSGKFPYISYNGVFISFPILFFIVAGFAVKKVRGYLKQKKLWAVVVAFAALPVVITIMDILWTPFLMERYRMDFYWIMGLLCFMFIGSFQAAMAWGKNFSRCVSMLGFLTICFCFILFLVPYDGNFTDYYPEKLLEIEKVFTLGLGVK